MPALVPTDHVGRIVWLGLVATRQGPLASHAVAEMALGFDGPAGDVHAGLTRLACVRVKAQHPRGTEIRNSRQLSLVSVEELDRIADALGIARVEPAWLGATLALEGLPDFSHLPPSSRLQAPSGATLVIDMQNRPCRLPGEAIEAVHPGKGARFASVARGRRGVTAWVERPGLLRLGDALRLHIPDQRAWRP